jgi:hypothetical protein
MQAAAGPVGQGRLSHEPRWLRKKDRHAGPDRCGNGAPVCRELAICRRKYRCCGKECGRSLDGANPARRRKWLCRPAPARPGGGSLRLPPAAQLSSPALQGGPGGQSRKSVDFQPGIEFAQGLDCPGVVPACLEEDVYVLRASRSTRPSGNAVSASQDKGDVLPGQRFQDLVQIDRGGRQAAAPLPSVLSLQEGDLLNGIVMPEVAAGGLHPLPFRVSGDQARPSSWLPGLHGSSQRCPELLLCHKASVP